MENLIGKNINHIYTNEDKDLLVIMTNYDNYAYYIYGDCCRNANFESIINEECLLNSPILEVRTTSPDSENRFICSLKTLKGYCDLEFRASESDWPYEVGISPMKGPFILNEINNETFILTQDYCIKVKSEKLNTVYDFFITRNRLI